MKRVYFTTHNERKSNYIRNALSRRGINSYRVALDIPEHKSGNLHDIVAERLKLTYEHTKRPSIAIDSGFSIDALNGFPGTYTNYALDTIKVGGILKLVDGEDRKCEFKNCLAYTDETLVEPVLFESDVEGTLALSQLGKTEDYHWSRLWTVFVPDGEEKAWAEMSRKEYIEWEAKNADKSFIAKFAEWFLERENEMKSG